MEFKAVLAVFFFISHSISPYKGAFLHLAQGVHGIECITVDTLYQNFAVKDLVLAGSFILV
jgi:hypothetical protein